MHQEKQIKEKRKMIEREREKVREKDKNKMQRERENESKENVGYVRKCEREKKPARHAAAIKQRHQRHTDCAQSQRAYFSYLLYDVAPWPERFAQVDTAGVQALVQRVIVQLANVVLVLGSLSWLWH